jgi:hypothetical protein
MSDSFRFLPREVVATTHRVSSALDTDTVNPPIGGNALRGQQALDVVDCVSQNMRREPDGRKEEHS